MHIVFYVFIMMDICLLFGINSIYGIHVSALNHFINITNKFIMYFINMWVYKYS